MFLLLELLLSFEALLLHLPLQLLRPFPLLFGPFGLLPLFLLSLPTPLLLLHPLSLLRNNPSQLLLYLLQLFLLLLDPTLNSLLLYPLVALHLLELLHLTALRSHFFVDFRDLILDEVDDIGQFLLLLVKCLQMGESVPYYRTVSQISSDTAHSKAEYPWRQKESPSFDSSTSYKRSKHKISTGPVSSIPRHTRDTSRGAACDARPSIAPKRTASKSLNAIPFTLFSKLQVAVVDPHLKVVELSLERLKGGWLERPYAIFVFRCDFYHLF